MDAEGLGEADALAPVVGLAGAVGDPESGAASAVGLLGAVAVRVVAGDTTAGFGVLGVAAWRVGGAVVRAGRVGVPPVAATDGVEWVAWLADAEAADAEAADADCDCAATWRVTASSETTVGPEPLIS